MALRAHPVRAALAPPAAFDLAANEKPRPGTVTVNGRSVPLHAPGAVHGKELAHAGIRVYDPGFAHTLSCTSSITQIDGAVGTLLHRGYSLESLPGACVYTEVVHLLLRGALPSATQHAQFLALLHGSATPPPAARAVVSTAPRSAHPMGVLVSALAAAGASMDGLNPSRTPRVYDSASQRLRAVSAILGGFPALAAGVMRRARGERVCFPPLPATADRWESARRFLWLVDSDLVRGKIGERRVRAVDALLTVHADHEQNCSTATLRQLASSGVDVFSAVAGATAALYGPLHGGASESVVRMLRRVGSVERVPAFLERVKRREERLMGFGHRVYKNYDPRARIVRTLVESVVSDARDGVPLLAVAEALEAAALADPYFVQRKLFPNVDFYSGLVYLSMGLEPEFFPVIFALGRSAGWMAHWLEFLDDPDKRIARPHQIYTGPTQARTVVPMKQRGEAELLPLVREKRLRAKM